MKITDSWSRRGVHTHFRARGVGHNVAYDDDKNVIGVVLVGEDEIKLWYLTSTVTASKTFGKSTYATWLRYFEGEESQSRCMVELLAYWLSLFVLLSGPNDGLNAYVFPLAILTMGEKLDMAPL